MKGTHRRFTAAWISILAAAALAACAFPARQPAGPLSEEDVVRTAAAKTVAAMATGLAEGKNPTLVGLPIAEETPSPPPTGTTGAAAPSPTAAETEPPAPDASPTRTLTPGDPDTPCNQAQFVRDVTIPDGSKVLPGSPFTKTWELKNTGSCAWDSGYSVMFAGQGDAMGGPGSAPLVTEGEVRPGETALVSVDLRAPAKPGDYKGYWMLRGSNNNPFGTGPNGASPFFVLINVAEEYSFAEHACSAEWSTAEGSLPCPGKEEDQQGFAIPVENPKMEDGQEREGPGILVKAQPVSGGYIVGRFPQIAVPEASDFRAEISCQPAGTPGAEGCYVRFRVTYQIEDGPEIVLGEWNEGYEGGTGRAVADLDALAGKAVSFNLYLYAAGTPEASRGIWFFPRIVK